MIPRLALFSLMAMTALGTSAKEFSTATLAPCVGKQFVQLQDAPVAVSSKDSPEAVCMTRRHLSVCRTMLDGDQPDNRTMKITVSLNGSVTQEWFESADPAYLKHIHVFVAQSKETNPPIVVATQQSESQGMGVQEWLVNAITISGRHTFTTSELGSMGSLVFDRTKPSLACKILLTRWESRQTKSGERLYLVGKLVGMDSDASQNRKAGHAMSRRLDRHLEQLRAANPSSRPLSYFARPVHSKMPH